MDGNTYDENLLSGILFASSSLSLLYHNINYIYKKHNEKDCKMREFLEKADILLPDFNKVDGSKWAVIACDQFTSEPDYWNEVKSFVGESASALNLVLPEIYLEDNRSARVEKINATMKLYLDTVLCAHENSMIYLERTDSVGNIRRGVIGKIDLEDYDYSKDATSLIRATEGTVLERIPPRVEVRKNAEIELPHVMLLIDDIKKEGIEKIAERKNDFQKAYDFTLMLGGGKACAYFMDDKAVSDFQSVLNKLTEGKENPLLFAVGDGNHSLATAKAHYEALKAELGDAAKEHPARYALAEVVNIHDDSLGFEPIFRAVFGADNASLISELEKYASETEKAPENSQYPAQSIHCIYDGKEKDISFAHGSHTLAVGTLQIFLDEYLKSHKECKIDYIHDESSLESIAKAENAVGFLFEGMSKSELFAAVSRDGALPRKTFSMGHARDKRYYIESRKIK